MFEKNPKYIDVPVNTIYKTYDYSKFKSLTGNRDIKIGHVQKIIKSMKIKQLEVPIIVNINYEIIDGQHTLEAIKTLQLPVYYIMIDDYGIKECQEFNVSRSNWKDRDYLETNLKIGNKEYELFQKFLEKYPEIKHIKLYKYLLSNSSSNFKSSDRDTFKSGEFIVKDYQKACINAEMMLDFVVCQKVWGNCLFLQSIFNIVRLKEYNRTRMVQKLSYLSTEIQTAPSLISYYDQLSKVYNSRMKPEFWVDFSKETIKWKSNL